MTDLPIFVYGTLRRGQRNYHLLSADTAAFRATLSGHALYGAGLPYVTSAERDAVVLGDLIYVAASRYAEFLARLDRLEGYRPSSPYCQYERVARTVRYVDATGAEATTVAWVYLAGPVVRHRLGAAQRIAGGDWLAASRQTDRPSIQASTSGPNVARWASLPRPPHSAAVAKNSTPS